MSIIYTKHAKEMLVLRRLNKDLVTSCIKQPDNILDARDNKKIYFKDFGNNFLKLVIAIERNKIIIVTLYWLAKKRLKK